MTQVGRWFSFSDEEIETLRQCVMNYDTSLILAPKKELEAFEAKRSALAVELEQYVEIIPADAKINVIHPLPGEEDER